jgi:hypothetical protein
MHHYRNAISGEGAIADAGFTGSDLDFVGVAILGAGVGVGGARSAGDGGTIFSPDDGGGGALIGEVGQDEGDGGAFADGGRRSNELSRHGT